MQHDAIYDSWMFKKAVVSFRAGLVLLHFAAPAQATNGVNLIGIGPLARSVGGVSIAAPQEEVSAVFANPAAMCVRQRCAEGGAEAGVTFFMPKVETRIRTGNNEFAAESRSEVYLIPSVGTSKMVGDDLRIGFAAYGISGLGVDYKDTAVDQPNYFDFSPIFGMPPGNVTGPLAAGTETSLMIAKIAPSVAYQPTARLSVGVNLQLDYGQMDLDRGKKSATGVGLQLGVQYKISNSAVVGATYTTPQPLTYKGVVDFDNDQTLDDLELAMPEQAGAGVALALLGQDRLVMGSDLKWINWSGAEGYRDFDWRNQWVVALGAEFKATEHLFLRAGYNYGNNPVRKHDGFLGTGSTNVQGKSMPTYYYETFRIVGFPAIASHHATFGVGYVFSQTFEIHVAYVHGFEETFTQTGTDVLGNPAVLESSVNQNSLDLGLQWRF